METEDSVVAVAVVAVDLSKLSMIDVDFRVHLLMMFVEMISTMENFDKRNSFDKNLNSVRIDRGVNDEDVKGSRLEDFVLELQAIVNDSSMLKDSVDNASTLITVELERPSNFDDEDVLQRTSSNFVHDIGLCVDQNRLTNVYASMDSVDIVEVLSPVHSFHIHQHLTDENRSCHLFDCWMSTTALTMFGTSSQCLKNKAECFPTSK